MRHPSDPAKLHQAAATLGQSVAEGGVSLPVARLVCAAMADAHLGLQEPVGYREGGVADQKRFEYVARGHGLRARLCWTAADTADAHVRAVWKAEDGLRAATRPMIEQRAPKAEIEEAAGAYAETLGWERTFKILRDEVARSRHKARWR